MAARMQMPSRAEGERLFSACHTAPQRKAQHAGLNLCSTPLSQKSPSEDHENTPQLPGPKRTWEQNSACQQTARPATNEQSKPEPSGKQLSLNQTSNSHHALYGLLLLGLGLSRAEISLSLAWKKQVNYERCKESSSV